ncbi:MAG: ATP-binding protein [Kofleriaceae bacterium]
MDSAQEYERLLQFLHACPVGIAELDGVGAIQMINGHGVQLLAKVAPGKMGFFEMISSEGLTLARLHEFAGTHGMIRDRLRVATAPGGEVTHLELTLWKVDPSRYMVVFTDVTAIVAAEHAQRRLQEQEAEIERARQAGAERLAAQHARLELAATILHDIGNAVTGIGTRVANLIAEPAWPEHQSLSRLHGLLAANKDALERGFPGKADALVGMLRAIEAATGERSATWRDSLNLIARGVTHVGEIISLHRRLVPDGALGAPVPVDLRLVVDDALGFLSRSFERRAIRVDRAPAEQPMTVSGDRTRLTQVAVNLLKNACEAFDELPASDARERAVSIHFGADAAMVELTISDNGGGFAPAAELFQRGATSKATGSGLGLASCLAVAQAHGGSLTLHSAGVGLGANAILRLKAA